MPITLNNEKEIGNIIFSSYSTIPDGYLLCNGSEISKSVYSNLFSIMPNITSTVTMTIASPCVVTWTSHGLATGHSIQFTTTGSLPTFSTVQTVYYIRVINTNTFNLYTTLSNAMNTGSTTGIINTSGTQSGVHTGLVYYWGNGNGSTTFNIPDFTGVVLRGVGTSTGYIQNVTLALGAKTDDAMQGHYHSINDPSHRHSIYGFNDVQNDGFPTFTGPGQPWLEFTEYATTGVTVRDPSSDGTNGTPRTATETRVKSVAINYFIKF
jgi:microcystin-dependent protein